MLTKFVTAPLQPDFVQRDQKRSTSYDDGNKLTGAGDGIDTVDGIVADGELCRKNEEYQVQGKDDADNPNVLVRPTTTLCAGPDQPPLNIIDIFEEWRNGPVVRDDGDEKSENNRQDGAENNRNYGKRSSDKATKAALEPKTSEEKHSALETRIHLHAVQAFVDIPQPIA